LYQNRSPQIPSNRILEVWLRTNARRFLAAVCRFPPVAQSHLKFGMAAVCFKRAGSTLGHVRETDTRLLEPEE